MNIFVDSNVYIALANQKDPLFEKARNLSKRYFTSENYFYISNLVLFEIATLVSMRVGRQAAIATIDTIIDSDWRIIRLDEALEREAWGIFKSISHKDISFVDCATFATLVKFKIPQVLSFDKDFERFSKHFGFKVLK